MGSGWEAGMEFEWDDAKAEANVRKHGVSFPEVRPLLPTHSPRSSLIPTIQERRFGRSSSDYQSGIGCSS